MLQYVQFFVISLPKDICYKITTLDHIAKNKLSSIYDTGLEEDIYYRLYNILFTV